MSVVSKIMDQVAYRFPPRHGYDPGKPSYKFSEARQFYEDHKKEIGAVYDAAQDAGLVITGLSVDMLPVNEKTHEYKMGAVFIVEHWQEKKAMEKLATRPMNGIPFRVEVRPPVRLA